MGPTECCIDLPWKETSRAASKKWGGTLYYKRKLVFSKRVFAVRGQRTRAVALQPADQQFALVDHLRRKMVVQFDEKTFMSNYFLPPSRTVHFHQIIEGFP